MIEIIAASVAGAALGFGAAFLIWRPKLAEFIKKAPEDRQFRVVFSTSKGAEARRLYEKVQPRGDGIVDFYDGETCRGRKKA